MISALIAELHGGIIRQDSAISPQCLAGVFESLDDSLGATAGQAGSGTQDIMLARFRADEIRRILRTLRMVMPLNTSSLLFS